MEIYKNSQLSFTISSILSPNLWTFKEPRNRFLGSFNAYKFGLYTACTEGWRFPFQCKMYFIRVAFNILTESIFHTFYFSLAKSQCFVLCPYFETAVFYSCNLLPLPTPSPTYNTTRLCFSPLSWVAGCKGWVIIGLLGYIQAGWRAGGLLVTGFPFFGGELGWRGMHYTIMIFCVCLYWWCHAK